MGFFDTIERLKNTEAEQLQHEKISGQAHQGTETKRQPGIYQAEKKAGRRPERFSFLRPCPLCGGINFIYGNEGGFFCQVCQPGSMGTPVEAGGADRQQPDHEAVFQVGLGEHVQNIQRGFLFSGSYKVTANKQEQGHFTAAWPWVNGNMLELLAAGWTRAALLQRSKYPYPTGWGIAWLPIWHQNGLIVNIGKNGEIIFAFESCRRTITQTARPAAKKNDYTLNL